MTASISSTTAGLNQAPPRMAPERAGLRVGERDRRRGAAARIQDVEVAPTGVVDDDDDVAAFGGAQLVARPDAGQLLLDDVGFEHAAATVGRRAGARGPGKGWAWLLLGDVRPRAAASGSDRGGAGRSAASAGCAPGPGRAGGPAVEPRAQHGQGDEPRDGDRNGHRQPGLGRSGPRGRSGSAAASSSVGRRSATTPVR